jgi:hypothetical protein
MKNFYNKAFTFIEVLIYIALFALVISIIFPILITTLNNYLIFKGSLDINSEVKNLFLRIQQEIFKSKNLSLLTDYELVLNQQNEDIIIFSTSPIYLNNTTNQVNGLASNLSIGSISFSSSTSGSSIDYAVSFISSSTCWISANTSTDSLYSFFGYAWSPNIGWIKFRNTSDDTITYGVCEDNNKELRGWAYNDIIGWISFNCLDTNVCGSSNYKVVENNNYLYGYAWNDNIGWIIFDGKGGKVYLAKKNPNVYYLDLISDPRVFIKELTFTQKLNDILIKLKIQDNQNNIYEYKTDVVLPFK